MKCDKCGKEYDNYHILVPDGYVGLVENNEKDDRVWNEEDSDGE